MDGNNYYDENIDEKIFSVEVKETMSKL